MTLKRYQPGDSFQPSASRENRIAAATEAVEGMLRKLGAGDVDRSDRGVLWCKNVSGTGIPWWGVVEPTGPLLVPSENLNAWKNRPSATVIVPTANASGRFGVALEPIPAGKIGPVAFDGLVVAQIEITDPTMVSVGEKVGAKDRVITTGGGTARIIVREAGTSGLRWGVVRLGAGAGGGGIATWFIVGADLYVGSNPKRYRYSLKRAFLNTANGLRTIDPASQLVYAHNLYEDSTAAWGHGQDLTPATGATLSVDGPVQGPVGAWPTGFFHADGTPLYEFEAPTPMGAACA